MLVLTQAACTPLAASLCPPARPLMKSALAKAARLWAPARRFSAARSVGQRIRAHAVIVQHRQQRPRVIAPRVSVFARRLCVGMHARTRTRVVCVSVSALVSARSEQLGRNTRGHAAPGGPPGPVGMVAMGTGRFASRQLSRGFAPALVERHREGRLGREKTVCKLASTRGCGTRSSPTALGGAPAAEAQPAAEPAAAAGAAGLLPLRLEGSDGCPPILDSDRVGAVRGQRLQCNQRIQMRPHRGRSGRAATDGK
jgi:hypothetical protein